MNTHVWYGRLLTRNVHEVTVELPKGLIGDCRALSGKQRSGFQISCGARGRPKNTKNLSR